MTLVIITLGSADVMCTDDDVIEVVVILVVEVVFGCRLEEELDCIVELVVGVVEELEDEEVDLTEENVVVLAESVDRTMIIVEVEELEDEDEDEKTYTLEVAVLLEDEELEEKLEKDKEYEELATCDLTDETTEEGMYELEDERRDVVLDVDELVKLVRLDSLDNDVGVVVDEELREEATDVYAEMEDAELENADDEICENEENAYVDER